MTDDVRKSLPQLIEELDEHRQMDGKRYKHKKSGDKFILMFAAFDEHTNDKLAVYCVAAFSRAKFVCPMDHFIESFELDTDADTPRE